MVDDKHFLELPADSFFVFVLMFQYELCGDILESFSNHSDTTRCELWVVINTVHWVDYQKRMKRYNDRSSSLILMKFGPNIVPAWTMWHFNFQIIASCCFKMADDSRITGWSPHFLLLMIQRWPLRWYLWVTFQSFRHASVLTLKDPRYCPFIRLGKTDETLYNDRNRWPNWMMVSILIWMAFIDFYRFIESCWVLIRKIENSGIVQLACIEYYFWLQDVREVSKRCWSIGSRLETTPWHASTPKPTIIPTGKCRRGRSQREREREREKWGEIGSSLFTDKE